MVTILFLTSTLLLVVAHSLVAHSHSHYTTPSTVPYLQGIFLSLYSIDTQYTPSQWEKEFKAMSSVGIKFVALRAALQGTSNDTLSGQCILGLYKAYYSTSLTPSVCYQNDMTSQTTFVNILSAAQKYNISVHITPVMPHTPFSWPISPKVKHYTNLAKLQTDVFMNVWKMYPSYHDTIVGVYTSIEEWNGINWMDDANAIPLATNYFEPLSENVRHLTGKNSLQVWASPYYVGNLTLHPTAQNASSYANFWKRIWKLAPSFDWIALQDSMGWQGNNFDEVKEVLIELKKAGQDSNRTVWSNVELFEGSPLPCIYPKKCGRQPASIERIVAQLKNEDPYVVGHIAWEWMSCLSPYTNAKTLKLYNDYEKYISTIKHL